jgi:RNA polymerase sigma factor (sigma-70 family)
MKKQHTSDLEIFKSMEENECSKEEGLHQLLVMHQALIYYYAHQLRAYAHFDDLVQEGRIGLVHAAKKFNINAGVTFVTYATYWIRQHMLRFLDQHTTLIRKPQYLIDQLRQAKEIVYESVVSLDKTEDDNRALTFPSPINNPSEAFIKDIEEEIVESLLSSLDSVNKEMMMRYFGFHPYASHAISELQRIFKVPKKEIQENINTIIRSWKGKL